MYNLKPDEKMTPSGAALMIREVAGKQPDMGVAEIEDFRKRLLETADLIDAGVRERDYWKNATAYLADCHAATAEHECSLKSVSARKKSRYRDICRTAAGLLDHAEVVTYWVSTRNTRTVADAASRCREVVEKAS